MDNISKLLRTAKICKVVSKILYILSCIGSIAFAVFAIVLPLTNSTGELTQAESAILFSILALYAFLLIDFFVGIHSNCFHVLRRQKRLLATEVVNILKRYRAVLLVSIIPALIGSVLIKTIVPESEVAFCFEIVGVITWIVLLIFGICIWVRKGPSKKRKMRRYDFS